MASSKKLNKSVPNLYYPKIACDNEAMDTVAKLWPDKLIGCPVYYKDGRKWHTDYMVTAILKDTDVDLPSYKTASSCVCTELAVGSIGSIIRFGGGFNGFVLSVCDNCKYWPSREGAPKPLKIDYNKKIDFELIGNNWDKRWTITGLTLLDSQKWYPPERIVEVLKLVEF